MLDGEAVILDDRGRSSFAELQADLDKHGSERAVFYAFDLLFLDGEALWTEPLYVRRLRLASIVPARSAILLSEDYTGDGAELFRIACEQELEGIVSKRLDKPYRGGRSRSWLKTICVLGGEFVIIGYQAGSGARRGIVGALHVATFDGHLLRYAGAVGTGFSEAVAAMLREKLDAIADAAVCRSRAEGEGRRVGRAGPAGRGCLPRRDDRRRAAACLVQGACGMTIGKRVFWPPFLPASAGRRAAR